MTNALKINETSVDQVYDTILKSGVADTDAKLLVSNWIYQNYRVSGRSFSYVTPFPAAVPECEPAPFQRSFAHKDWLDGEDLVQAGETAGDAGFNKRLHQIETDLDALGARIAKLVDCVSDMRSGLRKILDEIAAEFNRIDNDIAPRSNVIVDPVFTRPPIDVAIPPSVRPGAVIDPAPIDPRSRYSGIVPTEVLEDPGFRFLGSTVVENKPVSLFSSSRGVYVLPSVDASAATVPQRVAAPGAVAEILHDNADIKNATGNEVTKSDLVDRFGNVQLSNGETLRSAIDVLPDDARYDNADAMLKDLSERTANVIEATDGASLQLATHIEVPQAAGTFGGADVAALPDVPADAATKLKDAGITTIGQLATAAPDKVADALSSVNLSEGKLANIRSTARTYAKVGIFR